MGQQFTGTLNTDAQNRLTSAKYENGKWITDVQITGNKVKRITKFALDPDGNSTIPAGQEVVIIDNHEVTDNIGSWALNFIEYNRPSINVTTQMKIKVIFSDTPSGFDVNNVVNRIAFAKVFDVSYEDVIDKALLVPFHGILTAEDYGSNIMLAGKPYNYPLGKYMKVSLINNNATAAFLFRNVNLVEEGWL
jgi:hypothetical protein